MKLHITEGDLLDQPVEVIVNAWNRNLIPWWLLLPQGRFHSAALFSPPRGVFRIEASYMSRASIAGGDRRSTRSANLFGAP
jgi:hypothetical protein